MCMAGMLFLSSCSIKEDRDGCPCWMTVDLSDVAESRQMSPDVQSGIDYHSVTKLLKSRQHVAESVVLRLRGNSDEDAINYEYQVTEEVKASVGALEYEVPRGAVGVSAVAFGGGLTGQDGNDDGMPDQVGHDGMRAGYDGKQAGNEIRIPVGEQMDSLYGFFKMYHTSVRAFCVMSIFIRSSVLCHLLLAMRVILLHMT